MSNNRKEEILLAAKHAFSTYGYKATTMEQIAKIANIGKGTVYLSFSNKEELFNEIIMEFIRDLKTVAVESISPEDTFRNNLPRALLNMLRHRKEHQLALRLVHEANDFGTKEAKAAIKKIEQAITDFIKVELEKAIAKKEIRECNTEITAFVMRKLYIAMIFDWEKDHKPIDEQEMIELLNLYLLDGLSI